MYENTRSFADLEDQCDPLRSYRNRFYYPKNKKGENVIYFCGNSLGLQPKSVRSFIEKELALWEKDGVLGQHSRWEHFHERLTHLTAHIVGAKESEVVVMNALTVNLHLLLVSFYQPNNKRNKIVIEKGAFPSDQYAIKSQIKYHGFDPKDCLIEIEPKHGSKILQTKDIIDTILQVGDELATILFGGVNYYTGQAFDIKSITETGKTVGAFVGFD